MPKTETTRTTGSSRSVLIVEDNTEEAEIIRAALQEAGYSVDSCPAADRARDLISQVERHVDVLVLDLLLGPDFTAAFDLIAETRKHRPAARVLVLSGHGCAEHAVRALKAGAWDFLDKPAQPYSCRELARTLLPKLAAAFAESARGQDARRLHELERFSEDQLLDDVLIPLLKHMGFYGVRRVGAHGPGEFGLDILPFFRIGEFRERIYYGAQVKASPLTAAAARPGSAHEVLNQVRAALATTFVDRSDATRKRLDYCLVVCSGRITNDARRLLEESTEGRRDIILLDGSDTIDLLAQHNLLKYFDTLVRESAAKASPREEES